jgi:hypothetical protein
MKKRFKTLQDSDVASYLLRVQQSAKKEAPPIAGAMLEMSDRIARSDYYDIEKNYLEKELKKVSPAQARETMALYNTWKQQTPEDQEKTASKNRILQRVSANASLYKKRFRAQNPDIDAMLQVIGKYGSEPMTKSGRIVRNVLGQMEKQQPDVPTVLAFFGEILSEDVTRDKLYEYYQP